MSHDEISRTVPSLEETLVVGKREVLSGTVRIDKTVSERMESVEQALSRETLSVRRVAFGTVIEGTRPMIRQEGVTTIIPVIEERLIVSKQLILVEEVHLTAEATTSLHTEEVMVRKEHIDIVPTAGRTEIDLVQGHDESASD